MDIWVQYALVAAVFLSIKNMISKHLSGKYEYVDYLLYAISFSFVGIWAYVLISGHKPAKVEGNDILVILFRILIVYAILDPSIYKAFQACSNPAKASCVITIEVVITFILSIIFLKSKIEPKSIIGMILMLGGGYVVAYK